MTSTASLKKVTKDNDGQIYYAQIKKDEGTFKSGNASVALLGKLFYSVCAFNALVYPHYFPD